MKHPGSTLEFADERDADLLRAYRLHCAAVDFIRIDDIAERVANSPAKRFWVSEYRAMVVCSRLIRGEPALESMLPSKREMFLEIFSRVSRLQQQHPHLSLFEIVFQVVNSPAPKFYLSPGSAKQYIYKIRRRKYAPASK